MPPLARGHVAPLLLSGKEHARHLGLGDSLAHGDDARLEARIKNSTADGNLWAYDICLSFAVSGLTNTAPAPGGMAPSGTTPGRGAGLNPRVSRRSAVG